MLIHLDLDYFFLSAERTRTAQLKNRHVVVCKSGDNKIFSIEDNKSVMTESVSMFNGLIQHKKAFHGFVKEAWKKEFVDDQGRVHSIVITKSYEAKKYKIKTGTKLRDAFLFALNSWSFQVIIFSINCSLLSSKLFYKSKFLYWCNTAQLESF